MKHDIVVIGASAGGVEAVGKLLRDFPADLPASVFVVLHLSPSMDSHLPQIWSRASSLPVLEATNRDPIKRGHVYVAPPDHHLVCDDGRVALSRGPTENQHRPSVDTLFRSAAHNFGSRVVGIVLTGTLDDGTAGLLQIKRHGGLALVQSPDDAQFPNMPLSAIRSVDIDYILPLAEIGRAAASICRDEPVARSGKIIDSSSGEAQS
ncbi:MAG TPA: chemotaxis protein CheB [Candidatus Sulfotelmatobacter sp.]|nr:chemotaxis protein CheB [Candidatus Sulfotelmatobacter sp.]